MLGAPFMTRHYRGMGGVHIHYLAEARTSRRQLMPQPQQRRRHLSARGPLSRTTPIPPRPTGVEIATIVSCSNVIGSESGIPLGYDLPARASVFRPI